VARFAAFREAGAFAPRVPTTTHDRVAPPSPTRDPVPQPNLALP